MRSTTSDSGAGDIPNEIADDVYCVGPRGHTQTNTYFVRSGSSWVLIDTGWASDGPRLERAAASLCDRAVRPTAILLTHCHPDHSGAALYLARAWHCAVYMHPKELPIATGDFKVMQAWAAPVDRWIVLPLMQALGTRRREAILRGSSLGDLARAFEPSGEIPFLPDWQCVPTPGHTPGHVAYFRPGDRVLISGDAIVTLKVNSLVGLVLQRPGLSAPPWYTTWNGRAAAASIQFLARLEPTVLATGHGKPMIGVETAASLHEFARVQHLALKIEACRPFVKAMFTPPAFPGVPRETRTR
jgi:glyoxylase-like metal-dependent hydrolase (beta-lactamase superfamily II)